MVKHCFVLSSLLLLFFFVTISELEAKPATPKLCEKESKLFSGKCAPKKCDETCKGKEKAVGGACHKREGKDSCFCYFDCTKGGGKSPPSKGGSPPPAAGGSPPPPADGGSPPPAGGGSPPPADGGSPPPPAAN